MGILFNAVPIDVGNPPWYTGVFKGDSSDGPFQAIETYPYTSVPTVTSTDLSWSLSGGSLPSGLSLVANTGLVVGTPSVGVGEILIDAITVYPDTLSPAGSPPNPPVPYLYGSSTVIALTYSFEIKGLNTSTNAPASLGSFTITVLKDWAADVTSWDEMLGSPSKYTIGQK